MQDLQWRDIQPKNAASQAAAAARDWLSADRPQALRRPLNARAEKQFTAAAKAVSRHGPNLRPLQHTLILYRFLTVHLRLNMRRNDVANPGSRPRRRAKPDR